MQVDPVLFTINECLFPMNFRGSSGVLRSPKQDEIIDYHRLPGEVKK
jgi:hypothetical protein